MNNYKQEIIDFINDNKLNDVFTVENKFMNDYKVNLYVYLRVSTEKQEFGRQLLELHEWAKKKNTFICIDYIFCDKYTGKTLKRQAYQELKENIKENDYILVTEVSRLGRNWDDIKKEWYKLKADNINLLVMDYDLLSANLPNEQAMIMNVDKKYMQESIFNGILYASCKKIEEVSISTKNGLKKARLQGKIVGKPKGIYNTKENFIKTLDYMITNQVGQDKATMWTRYPVKSFKNDLKKCYNKYNTKDYKEILNKVRKDDAKWEQFY